MRVSDDVLHCVVFVCRRLSTGAYEAKGTAFVVTFPDVAGEYTQAYLVTARHVIEMATGNDGIVHLRVNTKDGGMRYVEVSDEWWTHDDPSVDLAAMPLDYYPDLDIRTLAAELLATDEQLARYEVGIGDEVSVVGLFTSVMGQQRNRPIARTGIIAAMPDEPIIEPDVLPFRAYLTELRSTGGLSGSPVAVMLGYDREKDGTLLHDGPGFIIGLIRGHWPSPFTHSVVFLADDQGQVNRGIATVTPIQYLAELLMSARALDHRRRKAQEEAAHRGMGTAP